MNGPVVVGTDNFKHSGHHIATATATGEARTRETALWLAHAHRTYTPVTQGVPPGPRGDCPRRRVSRLARAGRCHRAPPGSSCQPSWAATTTALIVCRRFSAWSKTTERAVRPAGAGDPLGQRAPRERQGERAERDQDHRDQGAAVAGPNAPPRRGRWSRVGSAEVRCRRKSDPATLEVDRWRYPADVRNRRHTHVKE
jgi:hypothetical protein